MNFREALRHYIEREARPAEKFGHQPRLYSLALKVGEGREFDEDIVLAAAWLHDLGVFIGHRPEDPEALTRWDHIAYSIDRTPGILMEFGFPADKIPAVLAAIRTHQPAGEPASIEGTILRDADILEQLGAIGILRTVAKVGRDTRFPTFTDAIRSLRHALESLPGQIRLETTQLLAAPKIRAMEAFFAAVEEESQSALY